MKYNHKLKNWKNGLLIFSLLLVVVLGLGCAGKETQISTKDALPSGEGQSGEPLPPITADLSIIGTPSLGQVVELTFSSKFYFDTENAIMEIFLPEGFVLVDGNLTFNVKTSYGEEVRIKSLVKAIKTGIWEIKAKVTNYYTEGEGFTNRDSLYINVSENSGQVSQVPFDYFYQGTGGQKEIPLSTLSNVLSANLTYLWFIAGILMTIALYLLIEYIKFKKQNKGGR